MKIRELTIGALLSAMALLIPLAFGGFLMVSIPPFTATIMSHVPLFLAMIVSPMAAVMVGLVSAIGFLIKLGPIVAARALMHAVVGYVGAVAIKKGYNLSIALAISMPFHALLEAIVVIPFYGFNLYKIFIVVALGTAIHHTVDSVIAVFIAEALKKAKVVKTA
ncbi:ECF transporter S component [Caloramator sp. E03]|uniref:ECF transporter S component n=1 Tax=Caloramator sp. E03 TaxID=2576307 RepID=UPI0011103994|nr:ECF transporter S component [Caloramator sp. E03]QCX33004.1 ECF transporter S component [Caloramator sp. E03]